METEVLQQGKRTRLFMDSLLKLFCGKNVIYASGIIDVTSGVYW